MYLLPKPKRVVNRQGYYEISWNTVITIDEKMQENGSVCASILQECIRRYAGIECAVIKGKKRAGDIFLIMTPEYQAQEYQIQAREDGLVIAGGDGAAVLYGVQTLCQIIAQCGGVLQCMEIEDAPDIKYRGYFLDETRGRVLTLDYLKKMADRLSRYKINQFQLYVEHTYLFRELTEMWRDETPLTAEDILELDAYCRKLHIELVPALASFGHLYMLLSTRSYGELCERYGSWNAPFSFWDRMGQHTINTADDRALPLIKSMIAEYGALFTSDKFNICADETFDLGCEKSRAIAEQQGRDAMYIRYVKELCTFLKDRGKRVQFFGDIICRKPELIAQLPQDTLCLTWGYAPEQSVDACHAMAQAGAVQYLCPGVSGWNQWINLMENSYRNIVRMCGYGHQYHAEGILNTDWGDFGHVNHPEFSVPGMIYGAVFSWNKEEIAFDEINRQISLLEYGDTTGQTAGIMAKMSEYMLFGWRDAVVYYETVGQKHERDVDAQLPELLLSDADTADEMVEKANQALQGLVTQMKRAAVFMNLQSRTLAGLVELAAEAIRLWNQIGAAIVHEERGESWRQEEAFALAGQLERWFMAYKRQWRTIGREGDLHHIAEIIFWYADCLRRRKTRFGSVK
ncbi:MAG: beta-N-acetylhexosaminidase [Lachnospiraceae bacterium]|nr:beta-N-acetylhexosaminidase [Lachnospiraceae bacterium]